MRYWLDTEFIEDGKTIDLISIGLVCEDGRELYLQSVEHKPANASKWVKENVLNHLVKCSVHRDSDIAIDWAYHLAIPGGECGPARNGYGVCPWRDRHFIRSEILTFMDVEKYGKPELWGWCAGYDFVAFCQLFGTMMDLPSEYPHYIRDIQYSLDIRGVRDEQLPEQKDVAHNALNDARYIKYLWSLMNDDRWELGVQ